MKIPQLHRKTALITGASAGIGRDLAREFARHGHDLVLVARRAEALKELANEVQKQYGVTVTILAKDLLAPNAAQHILDELNAQEIRIDFLVNNAGNGTYGDFLDTAPEALTAMLQLNIMALSEVTRLLAPTLTTGGAILNVASTAAFQPGPHMAAYYASKAYVLSLTEALAFELAPKGISVSALCPGPTASEFQQTAKMESARMMQQKGMVMSSEAVAKIGYAGLVAGKTIIIPGVANRLAAKSVRFFPRCVVTRLSAYMARSIAS